MLLDRVSTTQSFSDFDASEDGYSPVPSGPDRLRLPATAPRRHAAASDVCSDAMVPGDRVVFARLDLAEALGIWRHATGRVVETHDDALAAAEGRVTVDVQFEGHEILQHYLPDLFEKQPN